MQKFNPGKISATVFALQTLAEHYTLPEDLLDRHTRGDWGDISRDDWLANDEALLDGSRLFSSYNLGPDIKVWVITDAVGDDNLRYSTTIINPEEY